MSVHWLWKHRAHLLWGVSAASLIGTVGNIYLARWCFAVWFITNLIWVAVDYRKKIYPQAALHLVYAGLAVMGWFKWGGD
jgi:hypothetical protein